MSKILLDDLYSFFREASIASYTGNSIQAKVLKHQGAIEHEYNNGDFTYLESNIGVLQSHGSQTIQFKHIPIWICSYAGGLYDQNRDLARKIHHFLIQALTVKEPGFNSFRGPEGLTLDRWEYTYKQEGIHYQKIPVYYHRIIGGLIIS